MPSRCVVGGCSSTPCEDIRLHSYPSCPETRRKWDKFVLLSRKDWFVGKGEKWTTTICSLHFNADADYEGHVQVQLGFRRQTSLKKTAVPSILRPGNASVKAEKAMKKTVHKLDVARMLVPQPSKSTKCESQEQEILSMDEEETNALNTDIDIATELEDAQVHITGEAALTMEVGTQQCPDIHTKATQKSIDRPCARSRGVQVNLPVLEQPKAKPLPVPEQAEEEESKPTWSKKRSCFLSQKPDYRNSTALVFLSQLMLLFNTCLRCKEATTGEVVEQQGTCITVQQECSSCGYTREWTSQPFVRNTPRGNLLVSAAVLFSGAVYAQIQHIFNLMRMVSFSRGTFFYHQRNYLIPTIIASWRRCQVNIIQYLQDTNLPLKLAGDNCSDSPGHCAKFGTYTVMEQSTNKVLDFQLVQANQVRNSAWCELRGLMDSIAFLSKPEHGLQLGSIVTDRNRQVAKWLRESAPHIVHLFDIWHVAKGLAKKIDKLSREKNCEIIAAWKNSIINHLYWCAVSSGDGDNSSQVKVAKWESLLLHMQNKHDHHPNPFFPACQHPPLEGRQRDKMWLNPTSLAYVKLERLLLNKTLLKDIAKLSGGTQTSNLEAFHSLMLHFAPKRLSFGYLGMYARMCLTALHYNENSTKSLCLTEDGEYKVKVTYPKAKRGEHSVRTVTEAPTYDYAEELVDDMFQWYEQDAKGLKHSIDHIRNQLPPPLTAGVTRVTVEEAREQFMSRYRHH